MANNRERERPQLPTELSPTHEGISHHEKMVGLTTRLLLGGEQLNPAHVIPSVDAGNLRLSDGTVATIAKASSHNRNEYWKNRAEKTLDTRVAAWKGEMQDALVTLYEDLESDTEKLAQYQAVFTLFGIEDMENFSDEKAQRLYDALFIGDTKESNISGFVEHVARKYMTNPQAPDYNQLYEDSDALMWLGNIFGDKIAKTLPSLIEARIMRNDLAKRTEIAEKANEEIQGNKRVNRLTEGEDNEKDLITYIWAHGRDTVPTQPATVSQATSQRTEQAERTAGSPQFLKARLDIPRSPDAPEPEVYKTAKKLITPDGVVTEEKINLADDFKHFVESIEQKRPLTPTGQIQEGNLYLSDLARAMIDILSQQANRENRDIPFVIHGIRTKQGNKTVQIGAYIVPAFAITPGGNAVENHRKNARELAKNTGLTTYFREKDRVDTGRELVDMIIRPLSADPNALVQPNPSQITHYERQLQDEPRRTFYWGTVTNSPDGLFGSFTKSVKKNDTVQHQIVHQGFAF